MKGDTQTRGKSVVVRLEGPFDLLTTPAIRKSLLRAARRKETGVLEIDFSAVPHIDSSCVAVLVELVRVLRAKKGALRLIGFDSVAAGMISMADLDGVFKGMIHLRKAQ